MEPITHGNGSGRVDASWVQPPVNELAERLGVEIFDSTSTGPQRHCDDSNNTCVIFAGPDCHNTTCIPEDWDYHAAIIFVG